MSPNFFVKFLVFASFVLALTISVGFAQPQPVVLQDGTIFTPNAPAPPPPAANSGNLGLRLRNDVGELQDAEQAVAPLRGTTASVPASGWQFPAVDSTFLLWLGLIVLFVVGLVIYNNRQRTPAAVPPAPLVAPVATQIPAPAPPPPAPATPSLNIPIQFQTNPLVVSMNPGHIQLGVQPPPPNPPAPAPPPAPVVPPAPPAPAGPAPQAPLPAGVTAPGNCVGCGTQFSIGARFCIACGKVLPLLLFALLLFGFGQGTAAAQAGNKVEYHCKVNGMEGTCQPPATRTVTVDRTARTAAQTAQAESVRLRSEVEVLKTQVAAIKATPAPVTVQSAPTQTVNLQPVVDGMAAIEADTRRLSDRVNDQSRQINTLTGKVDQVVTLQNQVGERLTVVEAETVKIKEFVGTVAEGVLPELSTKGKESSHACKVYWGAVQGGYKWSSNSKPPKACPNGLSSK